MRENVFITGVHTGLGHALASRWLERGARVHAVSRSEPEDLAGRAGFEFRALDLRRLDEIGPTVRALLAGAEKIDVAILNAGVLGSLRDLREIPIDELRAVMEVNVWANKSLIDALMDLGIPVGHVVGISSGAAFNGSGGWGPYSISKSALNLLLRVYAHEHPGTHFTALAPGVIDTPMTREVARKPVDSRHPATARVRAVIEERRAMTPAAAAALLLDRLPRMREAESGGFLDIRRMD